MLLHHLCRRLVHEVLRRREQRAGKSLREPGLREQRFRAVGIVVPGVGERRVVERRPGRDRHAAERRAAAEERRLHDLLAPDRIGDRLPHAHVAERCARAVEQQVHERTDGAVESQLRIGLHIVHRLPRHVLDDVDIARLERRHAQVLVGIGDHADARQLRQAGLVELVPCLEVDPDAAFLRRDGVGARPDGGATIRDRPLLDDRGIGVRHPERQHGGRFLGDDPQRARVRRLDGFDGLKLPVQIGAGLPPPICAIVQATSDAVTGAPLWKTASRRWNTQPVSPSRCQCSASSPRTEPSGAKDSRPRYSSSFTVTAAWPVETQGCKFGG